MGQDFRRRDTDGTTFKLFMPYSPENDLRRRAPGQYSHAIVEEVMADIYRASLQAKYESIARVVSCDLGLGDDLTGLTQESLRLVHNAAEQAIFDWAARRAVAPGPLRPITNLQHLLSEYCAIADHL